jgi:hypothetical protein
MIDQHTIDLVIDALDQVKPQRGLAGGFTVKQISHMTKIHPERVLQALVRLEGVKLVFKRRVDGTHRWLYYLRPMYWRGD